MSNTENLRFIFPDGMFDYFELSDFTEKSPSFRKHFRAKSISSLTDHYGTCVEIVSEVLLRLSRRRRFQVREITLDMASNMSKIARLCFPAAKEVIDRFQV